MFPCLACGTAGCIRSLEIAEHQRHQRRLPRLGHPNLWVCDGSVFPTVGGVNLSLTIQAIAMRNAARIGKLTAAGER